MGVLGLTPFLQKVCPEAIQKLPDRLKGLTGKTIVIDGTLITQRFHFAPLPHRYRHVLGWYRLVQEVRESGVSAICVFDGKERSLAKAREVSRRRETRALAMARGALEIERLGRLRGLEPLLERFKQLCDAERSKILEALRESVKSQPGAEALSHEQELVSATVAATNSAETYTRAVEDFVNRIEAMDTSSRLPSDSAPTVEDTWRMTHLYDAISDIPFEPTATRKTEPRAGSDKEEDALQNDLTDDAPYFVASSSDDHSQRPSVPSTPPNEDLPPSDDAPFKGTPASPDDLASQFVSLYRQYRDSIPKVAALTAAPTASESQSDAQSDMIMTKEQRQLTLDEGGFWQELQAFDRYTATAQVAKPRYAIDALMQKSALMHASFDRRAHPPTESTYRESKEILAALGVPCIDATGAFEAEALASSMVLGGQADYVVSEDTDVLVYGAPLLRNLSNRSGPLVLLPSALWELLHLSRRAYVDFALLLGTDFSQRIKNVGPARALKFIRTYGTIERIVDEETKYPPRVPVEEYLHSVAVARAIFATLPPLPAREALVQCEVDETRVHEVLHQYDLEAYLRDDEWDYDCGVGTSFFRDDPRT